jgi:hypothetical protein
MPDEEIPPGTDLEGGAGGQHDPAPEWRPPASQEELDRLINKATAKVHGKYKDYDSVRDRDDGEPDLDKIGRKIKAVAPKAPPPPSFGQGNRGTAPGTVNMNDFIRKQAGVLPG